MPHPNPNLDRSGIPQSFSCKVASQINWLSRCVKGFRANAHIHKNFFWIKAHPEYNEALTFEQRAEMIKLEAAISEMHKAVENVQAVIENYYTAPKKPKPCRARQKAQRAAKSGSEGAGISIPPT